MISISPYYTGDSVPIRFTITDVNGAVNPISSTVEILKPDNSLTTITNASVNSNIVIYTVPATVTTLQGHYKAYFVNTLSYGERTHKIEFDVKVNPEVNR